MHELAYMTFGNSYLRHSLCYTTQNILFKVFKLSTTFTRSIIYLIFFLFHLAISGIKRPEIEMSTFQVYTGTNTAMELTAIVYSH